MINRFRDLREDADLSQAKMAKKLHMYTTTYARYERAERDIPLSFVITFAKYFNVSLDYLTGFIETPEPLIRGTQAPKVKPRTDREQALLDAFSHASPRDRSLISIILNLPE